MPNYELIIERRQPSCGGKAPTRCEVLSVTTDDPMAFVQEKEPGAQLELLQNEGGVVQIRAEGGDGLWVNYEFTED